MLFCGKVVWVVAAVSCCVVFSCGKCVVPSIVVSVVASCNVVVSGASVVVSCCAVVCAEDVASIVVVRSVVDIP